MHSTKVKQARQQEEAKKGRDDVGGNNLGKMYLGLSLFLHIVSQGVLHLISESLCIVENAFFSVSVSHNTFVAVQQ